MSGLHYLDFVLRIESLGAGFYRANVMKSPGGEGQVSFTLPFSENELIDFLPRAGQSQTQIPDEAAVKDFGERLFAAVFAGKVRSLFDSSLNTAREQKAGLRIQLRLREASELANLPWEYLYNPERERPICISDQTPIVRYPELAQSNPPLKVEPPLRILVMISAAGAGLDTESEWVNLQEAVRDLVQAGKVTIERLEKATLPDLQNKLREKDFHIFHFVGHGYFDPDSQDGGLLFEDKDSKHGRRVTGQMLGTLLSNRPTLRLAVLNACEGGRTSASNTFAGVAPRLIQQGVPAVIAMQFEITDRAAIALSHQFYLALADNYPVDAALTQARYAVWTECDNTEWGTPVLYMRASDGNLFDVAQITQEQQTSIQITTLEQAARAAMHHEDWATAIEKFEAVLELDPAHPEAADRLKRAQHRQEQATQRPPEQDDRPAVYPDEEPVDLDLKRAMRSEDKAITPPATDPGQEAPEKENGLFLSFFDRISHLVSNKFNPWIRVGVPVALVLLVLVLLIWLVPRNDSFESARIIVPGRSYNLKFVPWFGNKVDKDYFQIWVHPGVPLMCEVSDFASDVSPRLVFYGEPKEAGWLAEEDDIIAGVHESSQLSYTATDKGLLYILVDQGDRVDMHDNPMDVRGKYTLKCEFDEQKYYATPVPGTSDTTPQMRIHTVQSGDTMYNIARRHGVTVDKLRMTNNLSGDTIRVGQQLIIPLMETSIHPGDLDTSPTLTPTPTFIPTPTLTPLPLPVGFYDDFSNPGSGWPRQIFSIDSRGVLDANYDNGYYRMKILLDQYGLNKQRMGLLPAPYTHSDHTYDVQVEHRFVKAVDEGGYSPANSKAGLIFLGTRVYGGTGYFETFYAVEWNFEGRCAISGYTNYTTDAGHHPYVPRAFLSRGANDKFVYRNWGGWNDPPCPGLQAGYDEDATVRVEVRDNNFSVFLNNYLIGTYTFFSDLSGEPHMGLITGSWDITPVQSHFDNFRVTDR